MVIKEKNNTPRMIRTSRLYRRSSLRMMLRRLTIKPIADIRACTGPDFGTRSNTHLKYSVMAGCAGCNINHSPGSFCRHIISHMCLIHPLSSCIRRIQRLGRLLGWLPCRTGASEILRAIPNACFGLGANGLIQSR